LVISIYRKLQKHLDTFPIGFPETKSGVEIRLLEYFFTEREAEIVLHLSIIPQTLNQIYRRVKNLGYTKKHLKYILEKMVDKRTITKIVDGRKGKEKYHGDMLAIGLYENKADNMDLELSKLMKQYMGEGFRNEFFRKDTELQLRTIPVEKSFIYTSPVTTYDNIRELINQTADIAVGDCVCRLSHDLLGQPCKKTNSREWCFVLSYDGKPAIGPGRRRHLTKQEALNQLDVAEKEGFVLQPSNSQKPIFLCACCGCCCGVLSEAKHLEKPAQYFETNYQSIIDSELCMGCAICVKRCNMDAISLVDKKAVIDGDRCIGCGLCATTCPREAIKLVSKKEVDVPPKTTSELYLKILSRKTSKRKIFGMVFRTLLGLRLDPKYEK